MVSLLLKILLVLVVGILIFNDGTWTGTRGDSGWLSNKEDVNDITGGEAVPFKKDHPDFSKWSQGDVQIPKMVGKNSKDFSQANEAFAKQQGWLFKNGTPNKSESARYLKNNGLTWHHNEDGKTMQLIPTKLHENVPHTGGGSISRH